MQRRYRTLLLLFCVVGGERRSAVGKPVDEVMRVN